MELLGTIFGLLVFAFIIYGLFKLINKSNRGK